MKKKILLLIFILTTYTIVGMLSPFYKMRPVSDDFRASIDVKSFYSQDESVGPDRAGIIESNQDALDVRLSMINDAKEEIIISTFDIRTGNSTTDIFSALYAAAERGVTVRIIVDGMSSFTNMNLKPQFYAACSHPNITIKTYNTPNPFLPWTINGRMHDKYIVVDNTLLLAGGRNFFDYFLGTYEGKSVGLDRDVLIVRAEPGQTATNSCIDTVLPYFENMWNSKKCKTAFVSAPWFLSKKVKTERLTLVSHYQAMAIDAWDYEKATLPTNKITFLSNPTHIYGKEPYIWEQLYQLMSQAEQHVFIHTPYLVCSEDMYEGFRHLADTVPNMEVFVNSIASGDNVCASSDYRLNRPDILATGITLHEYMGSSSTHGKSLIVDDDIAVVGSYNFDNRSTYVDTETMFVIHSAEVNQQLSGYQNALTEEALAVLADESYEVKEGVIPAEQANSKKIMIRLLSFLIQPFRYLI